MSASPWESAVGETIGPYRLVAAIGQGRMGMVYEAMAENGEPMALKLVTDRLAQHEVFLRRFEREQQAAQQISHPNVLPVLDYGEHRGRPYLVQRLVRGGSLAERIRDAAPFELTQTLVLASGIAAGIDAMHASGLIHRDIEPANILLDGDDFPLVSDFGLCKVRDDRKLTLPGQALGTPHYMAPEQIRGDDSLPESDVYALGCVVWECLTGKPPFASVTGMRVLFAHLHDPLPNLEQERPDIPAPVVRAINRALEKDPAARPSSATAYVHGIQRSTRATPA
jgi:serine/threonine protein kinase